MTKVKYLDGFLESMSPYSTVLYKSMIAYVYVKFSKENPEGEIGLSYIYPFIINDDKAGYYYLYLGEL